MLVSLRHRTISSSNYEDSTIHLSGTSNHVLHIVGVTWTIDMRIVTISGLILNVCGVDGNTTLFLLRSIIDLIERLSFAQTFFCQNLSDGSGKSRLTVVNMANCTNVNMRFLPLKYFFCHNIMFKVLSKKPSYTLQYTKRADDGN